MAKIKIPQGSDSSSKGRSRSLFTNTKLGSVGAGIRDLGNVVTEETTRALQKRKEIAEADYLSNSMANASADTAKLQKSLQEEFKDKPAGMADKFTEGYKSLTDKLVNNAPTKGSKAAAKRQLAANGINGFKQMFNRELQMTSDNAIATTQEHLSNIGDRAYNNPHNITALQSEVDNALLGVKNHVSAKEFKAIEEKSKLNMADNFINGLIETDVDSAIKAAESKDFENIVGPRMADSYKKAAETRKVRIENEALAEREKAAQEVKVDRQIGIFNGKTSQADLERDLQQGRYGKEEYLSLSKELERSLKTENSVATSIADVNRKIKSAIPFNTADSDTKKDLNRYFENIVEPTLTEENFDMNKVVGQRLALYEECMNAKKQG